MLEKEPLIDYTVEGIPSRVAILICILRIWNIIICIFI